MGELISSKSLGESILVKINNNIIFGGSKKLIISGPCSVEDYKSLDAIACNLKKSGVHMLRGGTYKPRTSPYDFQGLGISGLKMLKEVSTKYAMPSVSEIMDVRDLEKALDYVDMIQVGSRNMYNYPLLKEIGKLKAPVLLKRGMSATLLEWLNAAEYILKEGNLKVVLCERGIRTFEDSTRNTLDLNSVALIKEYYRLPVIVDPSHGTGRAEIVKRMSIASIFAGADGLIIESHIDPKNSISDSAETITTSEVLDIVKAVESFSFKA